MIEQTEAILLKMTLKEKSTCWPELSSVPQSPMNNSISQQ